MKSLSSALGDGDKEILKFTERNIYFMLVDGLCTQELQSHECEVEARATRRGNDRNKKEQTTAERAAEDLPHGEVNHG